MQIVLLAAGLGSRLGQLTTQRPKALVEVVGQTLLERAVRFAERLAPAEIIVVGGFCFSDVAALVDRLRLPVALIENSAFREGNLLSLLAARDRLRGDFLMMNVDHIYRPAIASVLRAPVSEITAHIDTDRTLGDDDMKVKRDEKGRVHEIAKTLTTFDCGYVGMTRVPGPELARYFGEADRALAEDGRSIHVERVLARLAKTDRPPHVRDISGHGWLEVDFADERARAEAALAQGGWD